MGRAMAIVETETQTVRRAVQTARRARSSVGETEMAIATRHLVTIPRANLVVRANAMTQSGTGRLVMVQNMTDRRATVPCAMAPRPRMMVLRVVMRNAMGRPVMAN